jgi:hypothetical protein
MDFMLENQKVRVLASTFASLMTSLVFYVDLDTKYLIMLLPSNDACRNVMFYFVQ